MATADVTVRHGLPVTTVERTIADLVTARVDLSLVAKALGDAMRSGNVDLADLARRLAPLAARNGCAAGDGQALLNRLLRLAGLDVESMAKRLAGIEALARPIAADYLRDLTAQAQQAHQLAESVQVSLPVVTQFAAQAEALSKALGATLQPQSDSLRALQKLHAEAGEEWSKVAERLAPQLGAFATASRYASGSGFEPGRDEIGEEMAP